MKNSFKTWQDFPEVLNKKVRCSISEYKYDSFNNEIESNRVSYRVEYEIGDLITSCYLEFIEDCGIFTKSSINEIWFQFPYIKGEGRTKLFLSFHTKEEVLDFSEQLESIGL